MNEYVHGNCTLQCQLVTTKKLDKTLKKSNRTMDLFIVFTCWN